MLFLKDDKLERLLSILIQLKAGYILNISSQQSKLVLF